jgi:hypothetical protein
MVPASKVTSKLMAAASASKPARRLLAAVSRAAAWVSTRLSIAALAGVAAAPLLSFLPPGLLAPAGSAQPAAPVALVHAIPVPYLDQEPREEPSAAPAKGAPAGMLHAVARRFRSPPQPKSESGALGKAGMDADETKTPSAAPEATKGPASDSKPDPKAAAPADPKSAKAEPPEPDTWSDTQVIAGLRDCLRRLAPLGAEIEIAEPIKHGQCGTPAPVVLKRLGPGAGKVEIQPPAMLNCAMVASLNTWVEKTMQPAAREMLGSPIVRIRAFAGYNCRNRIGTAYHADRLSEHAFANAIDIAGFVTADGRTVDVLSKWGPTARELREQQEKAWEAAQAAKAAAKQAESDAAQAARAVLRTARGAKRDQAAAEAARRKEEAARKKEEAEQRQADWRKSLSRIAEMQKLGRGSDEEQAPRRQRGDKGKNADQGRPTPVSVSDAKNKEEVHGLVEAAFLRRLHKGACGTFGTVLGPDANAAHRNHFHLDLAARKHGALCE